MLNQFLQATIFLHLLLHLHCRDRNVGSVLFNPYQPQDSWTLRDLERLKARRVVQEILPTNQGQNIDSAFIRKMLSYFNASLQAVRGISDENTRMIVTEALADTIGGYMRSELLPEARYAFYAGRVRYKDLQDINSLYQDAKDFLNTQGLGWAPPKRMPLTSAYGVETIDVECRSVKPCSRLVTLRDSGGCIIIPKPQLIEREKPSAIALPLRRKPLMSLLTPRSENVFIRFYKLATQCILQESPAKCRSNALVRLNRALCKWIDDEVRPHLDDEQLYIGFGSILRLSATAHQYCDTSELTEYPKPRRTINSINKEIIVENKNTLIALITAIAAITWLFVWMLTYSFKKNGPVSCSKKYCRLETPPTTGPHLTTPSVAHEAPADMTFQAEAAVPSRVAEHKSPSKRSSNRKSSVATLKGPAVAAVRTEVVYDLNDEKMKEMSIPECALAERDQRDDISEDHILNLKDIQELTTLCSASAQSAMSAQLSAVSAGSRRSPPRIDTHVSQIIHKKSNRSAARSAVSPRSAAKVSASLSSSAVWTSSTEASSLADERRGRGGGAKRAVARIAKDLAWAKRLASRKKRESKKD